MPRLFPTVFLLASCLGGPDKVFTEGTLLLDIPAVRQENGRLCGLAALEMLTAYHKIPSTPEETTKLRAVTAPEGLSGEEMTSALSQSGYEVSVFSGSLGDGPTALSHHISKGRPLIVMIRRGKGRHYVMVAGHDKVRHLLALVDPALGTVSMTEEAFLRAWDGVYRFTLLALPREGGSKPPPS